MVWKQDRGRQVLSPSGQQITGVKFSLQLVNDFFLVVYLLDVDQLHQLQKLEFGNTSPPEDLWEALQIFVCVFHSRTCWLLSV